MKLLNFAVHAAESLGGPIEGVGNFQTAASSVNPCSAFGGLISALITTITVFGGIAFVIYFFIGALKWITAGGDKGKVAEAQTGMTQGAVGLIALVSSYFVIGIVGAVLGLDILRPFNTLFGTGCSSTTISPSQPQFRLPNGRIVQ